MFQKNTIPSSGVVPSPLVLFQQLPQLSYEEQAACWWRLGRVMASGLGSCDKLLLITLLLLDPRGQGLELSWGQLAEATSLSASSVRRTISDLRDWGLLSIESRKTVDRQPLANRITHLLVDTRHPFLQDPCQSFYRREEMDNFLRYRSMFEQLLEKMLQGSAPAKGTKLKLQGRKHKRAPRSWRQKYGMFDVEGKALQNLVKFEYPEFKGDLRGNLEKIIMSYTRSLGSSFRREDIPRILPSHCLAWVHQAQQRRGV